MKKIIFKASTMIIAIIMADSFETFYLPQAATFLIQFLSS